MARTRSSSRVASKCRPAFSDKVSLIALAHRLQEVRVQYGFTRLEPASQDNQGEYDINVRKAPLSSDKGWLPATTVQGEGVFLELSPNAIAEWSNRPAVVERAKMLHDGFQKWYERNARARNDGKLKVPPFLGARFYLLHSLSHLLITAISLECGYAASSIRERIYCGPYGDDKTEMSGILLYTGTPGSEGTLGGLVEQGRRLEHHLNLALRARRASARMTRSAPHTNPRTTQPNAGLRALHAMGASSYLSHLANGTTAI